MRNTSWASGRTVAVLAGIIIPVFCLALGFWVVSVRPGDGLAWLLLGLLFSFAHLLSGALALRGWGSGLLTFTFGYTELVALAWPIFMFLFGFYFPEALPIFRRPGSRWRWLPAMVVTPYAILGLSSVAISVVALNNVSQILPLHPLLRFLELVLNAYVFCLVGGFFGFIFTKSSMPIPLDSKRRLRLLYWGATLALAPVLLFSLAAWLTGKSDFPDWLETLVFLMLLIFPISLAYVIVVQRAMDVRVVVRQGLQYTLARNGVRILQILAVSVVTLTAVALIGQNRDRPQKIIVIAVGLLAIFTIRRLTERVGAWIDRRFFREAYDAEKVLSELSDGVRSMVDVHSLIQTVAERISQTLHIPRVAVLLGGGGPYRPAYALGYGHPPDIAFPLGAGTVKVLQRQKEPARVYFDDPHSWLYRESDVTEEDRSSLNQLDAELLLPLSARDKLLGFISLGPKRSDEPYSRADLRLLKSVATQTGLALENARLISAISDEVAQRERLNSEVQIARDVQERLFPQKLIPIPGIAYAGGLPVGARRGRRLLRLLGIAGRKIGHRHRRRFRQGHRRGADDGQLASLTAQRGYPCPGQSCRADVQRESPASRSAVVQSLCDFLLRSIRSGLTPVQLCECWPQSAHVVPLLPRRVGCFATGSVWPGGRSIGGRHLSASQFADRARGHPHRLYRRH